MSSFHSTAERRALAERLREAVELLESIAADRSVLAGVPDEERKRLLQAVASVYHPDRVERRRMAKGLERARRAARVGRDQAARVSTGIQRMRRKPLFHSPNYFLPAFAPSERRRGEPTPPGPRQAHESQHCYICKEQYSLIHRFYDQLCPSCAPVNFAKRTELADLKGRVALLTGGRVKIGYQAGLKLLRSGAHLIVTTRFPRDAATRYAQEPDCPEWSGRRSSTPT